MRCLFCSVLLFRSLSALHFESANLLASSRRPCDVDVQVPDPLAPEYLATVYDTDVLPNGAADKFKDPRQQAQLQAMRSNISDFAASCRGKQVLKVLMNDGLVLNYFGMDFTGVYEARYASLPSERRTGGEMEADEDVNEILGLYFPTRVNRVLQQIDFPQMMFSFHQDPVAVAFELSSSELALLRSFQRNGFVIIDQWPELDIAQHLEEVDQDFGRALILEDSKSLKPMTDPRSLMMKLSSAYLGSTAHVHGSAAHRLEAEARKTTYVNAPWHTDGCGRRVKAWIYHHDIDKTAFPTRIAAGTQKNHWFPSVQYFVGELGTNKLNPDLVTREFGDRIHKMIGKKGGGFLFDTNTIHGAVTEGRHHKERRTTLIELSTKEHMQLPREDSGPDDGYLSAWTKDRCPDVADR